MSRRKMGARGTPSHIWTSQKAPCLARTEPALVAVHRLRLAGTRSQHNSERADLTHRPGARLLLLCLPPTEGVHGLCLGLLPWRLRLGEAPQNAKCPAHLSGEPQLGSADPGRRLLLFGTAAVISITFYPKIQNKRSIIERKKWPN